jgi:hypothetical protein
MGTSKTFLLSIVDERKTVNEELSHNDRVLGMLLRLFID